MNKRVFGKTGRMVGEVGLGAWQIGGNWGDVSDETALQTLRAAVESGTDFIDTADVYGGGRSERLIGRFLKDSGLRGKVFVSTKLGRRGDPGWPGNFTEAAIRGHTEDSLRNLGVDALDLTQLHCIPPDVLMSGEPFAVLQKLRQEGKIKAYGASVEAMDEAVWCCSQPGCSSLQIIFNIFRQKPVHTLFDAAKRANVAILVRLPLASGLLGGKMTKATKFPEEDHRNFNRDGAAFNVGETFAGIPFEKGVELADGLRPFVPPGMSMAAMSLRWCLDFDAVSVIIPGAKNPDYARANAAASTLPPLGADLHGKLASFYQSEVAAHIRGPY